MIVCSLRWVQSYSLDARFSFQVENIFFAEKSNPSSSSRVPAFWSWPINLKKNHSYHALIVISYHKSNISVLYIVGTVVKFSGIIFFSSHNSKLLHIHSFKFNLQTFQIRTLIQNIPKNPRSIDPKTLRSRDPKILKLQSP